MLDAFSAATFEPLIGDGFHLSGDEGAAYDVELERVHRLSPGGPLPAGMREPFTLTFRGPAEPTLSQRTYSLRHEGLGEFELFLVPISRGPDGVRYEAVFG